MPIAPLHPRRAARRAALGPLSVAARPALLAALCVACGTNAPSAGGDENLPNAAVGPFRVLRAEEMGGKAPLVTSDAFRSPGVVDLDGDPATLESALYVASGSATLRSIYRYELPDGRTSSLQRVKVLERTEAWEPEAGLDHPMPLRVGEEIWLYYASGGCIGRAVSSDAGVTFEKRPATPLLCADPAAAPWEQGGLTAPSVHVAHDGSYRLLYETPGGIGEAASADGQAFSRRGGGPVLAAASPAGPLPEDGGVDDPFDNVRVGDPCALLGVSPLGRPVTYLYYTGQNRLDRFASGMAARFGDDGAFTRNPAPVLTRFDAHAPFVMRRGNITLIYAEGRNSETKSDWKPAIIGGLAPATAALPAVARDGGP
jgi:hypothetical protein